MSNESNEARPTPRQVSRRKFVRIAAITAVASTGAGAILAACGDVTATVSSATTQSATTAAATSATTAASMTTAAGTAAGATTAVGATNAAGATTAAGPASATVLKSTGPGVPDAYLAPPPVFKSTTGVPGKGGTVKVLGLTFTAAPPPRSENKYWQELEKRLGVTWDITLVPDAGYIEKIAVLTASGDLPDLTFLELNRVPEQRKIIQQGGYTDLTPFLTGSALNDYPNLAAYPPQIWKNIAIKGKIYGVPRPRLLTGDVGYIRKDWIAKAGNHTLNNADDVYKLLEFFTKGDPNGDGQANTWGYATFGISYNPWINYMHRVPYNWRKNGDGSLTYYLETPEYKQSLEFIRRMYQGGLIYPDTYTLTYQQFLDSFLAGKYGATPNGITGATGANGIINAAKKINPNADMTVFVPPGFDGGKSINWQGPGFFGFAAIPAKVGKDAGRVKELLGILNYLSAPFGSEEYNFRYFGIDGVHNDVKPDGSRVLNSLGQKEIVDLPGIANAAPVAYYPGFPDQPALIQNTSKVFLESSVPDPTLTGYSATWASKGKELNQLVDDRVLKIITGRDPLTALDDAVKEWKSRGGSQVATEFADSLKVS